MFFFCESQQVPNTGGAILLVNAQEPVDLKYRADNEAPRSRTMSLPILPNPHDFLVSVCYANLVK